MAIDARVSSDGTKIEIVNDDDGSVIYTLPSSLSTNGNLLLVGSGADNITETSLANLNGSELTVTGSMTANSLRADFVKFDSDNGPTISRLPRVIEVKDEVSGCPPTRAAGTEIMRMDWSMARAGFVNICYSTIVNYSNRADHTLYVDGVAEGSTLTSTNDNAWKPVTLTWGGELAAGSHNCYIVSNTANVTGCGNTWGRAWVTIYE